MNAIKEGDDIKITIRKPRYGECDACPMRAQHHIIATFEGPGEKPFAKPIIHRIIGDACDTHKEGVEDAVLKEAWKEKNAIWS